jgi:hypothetical protein
MKRLLVLVLLISQSLWARDAGSFATKDFTDIESVTSQLTQSVDPQDLLVVFDIDNTLLRLERDLGSEQWFLWQRNLLEKGTQALPLVATTIDDLLTIQTWIYNVIPTTLATPQQGPWIRGLRARGASVITLTSRVLSTHDASLRELNRHQLNLSTATDLALPFEGIPYIPYSLENPSWSGLTPTDLVNFKLSQPKQVLFDRGLFLTQGQHKGAMLKTLLSRMQRKFKAIIFIDDRSGHIEAMRQMATTIPHEIYSLQFNLSETWTKPFIEGPKDQVEADWCAFATWLNETWYTQPNTRIYRSCPTGTLFEHRIE